MNVPKIRFSEFNNDYEKLKYGDVLKIKSGRDQKQVECENGKYPILGTGGEIGRTNSFLYNKPSVLIGRKGTINKPQYMETPFWTVDTLFYSEIFDKCHPKYLYYSFQNVNWKKYDESTGVPSLSCSTIEKVDCYIPKKTEQIKVSNFLSLLDKKIELQYKKIEDLKLFKKGLINNELNCLNNCQSVSLNDLGITYSGLSGKTKEDFENGNCKFINFMSVLKDNIDISSLTTVKINPNEKQNKVEKGDLFFMTSSETKEEVALCYTLSYDVKNLYLNSFCFGYRINDLNVINNEYLNCLLHSPKYRKQISNLGQGFTRVNISKNKLLELLIEVPDMKQQLRIVSINNKLNCKINLENEKLNKLSELKKGLMQKMFV